MDSRIPSFTDEIGMPLPVLSLENAGRTDSHHHFHPRRSPILTEDFGGLALRTVRLQKTDYGLHHDEYHREFIGPPLPESSTEKFGLVVLACAGYIPEHAVDLTTYNQPTPVTLTANERRYMWNRHLIRVGSTDAARKFLSEFMIQQDVSHVKERTLDEFVHTTNEDRKLFIGHSLLMIAIEQAIEPLSPFYKEVWQKHFIPHKRSPILARQFKKTVRYERNHQKFIADMRQHLEQAA